MKQFEKTRLDERHHTGMEVLAKLLLTMIVLPVWGLGLASIEISKLCYKLMDYLGNWIES